MSKILTMQTLDITTTEETIKDSLKRSMSYAEYSALIDTLVEEHTTTGNEKTAEQIEFTGLNQKRMKRWDKTLNVSEEDKHAISQYDKKTTWLVLTESWCGDAAHIVPAI
ncbi:MAG: thioredoxin family protein, partial [Mangrovimonas sp.]|nr:thioredoxin family protein [Mangrovimonas sp.]